MCQLSLFTGIASDFSLSSYYRPATRAPLRLLTISNSASSVETDIVPDLPLPPGTLGLPFIGETLENFSNEGEFHMKRHGPFLHQLCTFHVRNMTGTLTGIVYFRPFGPPILGGTPKIVSNQGRRHFMRRNGFPREISHFSNLVLVITFDIMFHANVFSGSSCF
jgi:hypothetical protein